MLNIPPNYAESQVMGYLKGKSSLMIFDRFSKLKYKLGNRLTRRRLPHQS